MPETLNLPEVELRQVGSPETDAGIPVMLTDKTMQERLQRVLARMQAEQLDSIVFWCDLEHGSNFEYLTGFLTRFEEGLLVLKSDGDACLILGNENLKLGVHSRLKARVIHCPYFSLPNQPMDGERSLAEIFREAGIGRKQKIGVVGWKLFRASNKDSRYMFDLPEYVMCALREAADGGEIVNAAALMIGPGGARTVNNANEIAHYAFGSALASDCVIRTMDTMECGMNELELAGHMQAMGQDPTVVTICAAGPRYEHANLYPRSRILEKGDTVSLTCGYKGGLASRSGYAVVSAEELPPQCRGYIKELVEPYFRTVVIWLEQIRIGMTGGQLFELVDTVLPRERYHWKLCPGHLTADEEWLSSPVYEHSEEILQSGMMLQLDIIPSVQGYGGTGCENGIVLADESLRSALREEAPEEFARMQRRREWIGRELGIRLPEHVLPLSSGVGYLRPYMLAKGMAMTVKH